MQPYRIATWACALLGLAGALSLASSCSQSADSGGTRANCLHDCDSGRDGTSQSESGNDVSNPADGGGDVVEETCPTCSGTTPVCDTSTLTCVQCLSNNDCGAGTICSNKTCIPGCAADHTDCGADGGDCDIGAGVCRQCLKDADCGGANPRCDLETFQCVPCLLLNDNCSVEHRCVKNGPGQYVCALGCNSTRDCNVDGGASALACCNNLCVDTGINGSNCGSCGHACVADGGIATTCCNFTCQDTQTDPDNCGGCGIKCSSYHMATRTCSGGVCNGTCATGYDDCNGNKQSDGCELNTASDPDHCGDCTTVCSSTNTATRACSGGVCSGIACAAGYSDCNGNASDGCEINTASDPNHCGGCGTVCSSTNMATRTCSGGVCNGTCAAGYSDCNGDKQSDGCELNTAGDPNNCGGCGTVCSSTNMATRTCSGGVCNGTCATGYSDCNADKQSDGCEFNSATDPDHCGGCSTVCSSTNMTTRTCSGGVCDGTCVVGYTDCNGNKQSDGCETNLASDPNHCGGCGTVCSSTNMATRTCSGGVCDGTCTAGYTDCNGNKQSDGCETNLASDPNHCGGCGTVCSGTNVLTRSCTNSTCTSTCITGFTNCDGTLQQNGCNVSTQTALNCGGCAPCNTSSNNTSRSCNGNTCSYVCSAGHADCNSGTAPDTDGCECAAPACGGNGCANATVCPTVQHTDGVGQSFYDCTAVNTFTSAQALEACKAYATSQGHPTSCSDLWTCSGGGPQVCYFGTSGGTTCVNFCWGYTNGIDAGWVTSCACPEVKSASWN